MIAVDTNVIVRLVTQDDPAQARAAEALMDLGPFLVTRTVVLEVGWVLARAYGLDRPSRTAALRTLLGLENAVVEDRDMVLQALDWHDSGLSLSDALHLAAARDAETFATFDRRFASTAARIGVSPSVLMVRRGYPDGVRESRGKPRAARRGAKRKATSHRKA